MGKERELRFIYGVQIRYGRAIVPYNKNLTAVDILLGHKLDRAVAPTAANGLTVSNVVDKRLTMGQDVVCTKCVADGGFRLRKPLRIHPGANIAAVCGVCVVHNMGVQGCIGDNDSMMGGARSISRLVVIIESGDTPVDAADHPVIADIQVGKRAVCDRRPLFGSHARAQVFAPIGGVMRAGIVNQQRHQPDHAFLHRLDGADRRSGAGSSSRRFSGGGVRCALSGGLGFLCRRFGAGSCCGGVLGGGFGIRSGGGKYLSTVAGVCGIGCRFFSG